MAIEFIMADKSRAYKEKGVIFPDKVRSFLQENHCKYSKSLTLLLELDEYADTLLMNADKLRLISLCNEILDDITGAKKENNCLGKELKQFALNLSELLW